MKDHYPNLNVEIDGPTLIVCIARPDVRNAVDGAIAAALTDVFRDFDADDSLSVAILRGGDDVFCAGADLKAFSGDPVRANPLHPEGDGPMGPSRMQLGKPVIAAIAGHCVAGGLELACWCDMRVADTTAVFGYFVVASGCP